MIARLEAAVRRAPVWWALGLVLAIGVSARLAIASMDVIYLLNKTLPDDAFYYFQIARHIADGDGVTADGINAANGFHPLWLLVNVPFFVIWGDHSAIRGIMVLSALIDTAAVTLTFLIVRRLTGNAPAALFAAALYAFNPRMIFHGVSGIETPLAIFFLALTVYLYVWFWEEGRMSWRQLAIVGVSGALMSLSRLDYGFVFAALLAHYLVTRRDVRGSVTLGGVGGLVVLPWAVWMLTKFGTLLPSSGSAIAYRAHIRWEELVGGASLLDKVGHGVRSAYEAVLVDHSQLFFLPGNTQMHREAFFMTLGAVVGVVVLSFLRDSEPARLRRQLSLFAPPALGILAAVVANAGVRWFMQEWYYVPLVWAVFVLAGIAADQVTRQLATQLRTARARVLQWAPLGVAAGLFAIVYLVGGVQSWERGIYNGQRWLAAANWASNNLPADAVVGSTNSGVLGFYTKRTVINLDGVVNPKAYEAIRERRLLLYVEEAGITHLIDGEALVLCHNTPFYGVDHRTYIVQERVLDRVRSFTGVMGVWRLDPPAARALLQRQGDKAPPLRGPGCIPAQTAASTASASQEPAASE